MAQEAEVRLKLVVTGDTVQVVDRITGAIKKAASAEDNFRVIVERTNKAMREGGGGRGGAGVGGGGGVGHAPGGRPGFGGQALSGVAGAFGLPAGRMGVAAGAAAAVGVLHMGAERSVAAGAIRSNPWLTQAERENRLARNVPVLGAAFGLAEDTFRASTGRDQQLGQIRQEIAEGQVRVGYQNQQASVRFSQGFAEQAQGVRAETFAGLRLQRPAGHDRGTVAGAKLFEEEAALLPLIRQRQVAARERLAAEKIAGKAAGEEADLRRQLGEMDKELVRVRKRRDEINAPGSRERENDNAKNATADILRRETELAGRREHTSGLIIQAEQRTSAAKGAAGRAGFQEAQAAAAVRHQEAQALRQREMTARGQARGFGTMGVEGRTQGRLALQLLQQIGVENAPANLIQAAAAYAPETVGKMAETTGERELGVADRLTGRSGEFRDTDLKEIGRRADKADEAATAVQEKAIADVERILLDAVKGMADRIVNELGDTMSAAIARLRADMALSNFQ